MKPIVHLNGSGFESLKAQQQRIADAAYALQKALEEASPHMRDYYPLGDKSDEEFRAAQAEIREGLQAVEKIAGNAAETMMHIVDQRR